MKTRGEILTVEDDRDLQPEAEKYSDISTLQSIFAGLDRDWETSSGSPATF